MGSETKRVYSGDAAFRLHADEHGIPLNATTYS
jgi:hypothetical protein